MASGSTVLRDSGVQGFGGFGVLPVESSGTSGIPSSGFLVFGVQSVEELFSFVCVWNVQGFCSLFWLLSPSFGLNSLGFDGRSRFVWLLSSTSVHPSYLLFVAIHRIVILTKQSQ